MKCLVRLFLVFTFIFAFTPLLFSQNKGIGAGVILGEPTAISAKFWLGENNALDAALGYSFDKGEKGISLHADFVYHLRLISDAELQFPLYYGFGLRFRAREKAKGNFGVRGVIGILWWNTTPPIDVFFELAPVFKLFPSTELDLDAGIGARYYF